MIEDILRYIKKYNKNNSWIFQDVSDVKYQRFSAEWKNNWCKFSGKILILEI